MSLGSGSLEERDAAERLAAFEHVLRLTARDGILDSSTIAAGFAWLGRQLQRARNGEPLNLPKYLLLAAAIPMHWVVLLTPMPHKPIAIVAMLTIFHNLQYHRLVWFHNRKYTNGEENARQRFGAAEIISRRLPVYIIFGLLFGIWYQAPRQYINHGADPESFLTQMASGFLWGYAFIHYHLDAHIWRVRRDPSVGKALKME